MVQPLEAKRKLKQVHLKDVKTHSENQGKVSASGTCAKSEISNRIRGHHPIAAEKKTNKKTDCESKTKGMA